MKKSQLIASSWQKHELVLANPRRAIVVPSAYQVIKKKKKM